MRKSAIAGPLTLVLGMAVASAAGAGMNDRDMMDAAETPAAMSDGTAMKEPKMMTEGSKAAVPMAPMAETMDEAKPSESDMPSMKSHGAMDER